MKLHKRFSKSLLIFVAIFTLITGVIFVQIPNSNKDAHKIAVILPHESASMEELIKGFQASLRENNVPYQVSIIYQHDKVVLASQVDEAIKQGYKLFVAAGRSTAQSVVNVVHKRSEDAHVVYTAVNEPQKYGIAGKHNDGSIINSTGVEVSMAGAHEMLKPIFDLKPDLKKVCILHSPYKMLEQQATEFKESCKTHGVICDTVIIDKVAEAPERLKTYLSSNSDVELLITFSDPVLNACGSIIKLAKLYGIELFAGDEASVKHGAAYANCVTYKSYGYEAGNITAKILLQQKQAHEVPAHVIYDSKDAILFVNPVGLSHSVPKEALRKYYKRLEVINGAAETVYAGKKN